MEYRLSEYSPTERKVDVREGQCNVWYNGNCKGGFYTSLQLAFRASLRYIMVLMVKTCFDQVSEFDRRRIVAFKDCGLSFRVIGQRVGRNQATLMRVCHRWIQEETMDLRGRSHPPRCTNAPDDRWIVRMAVMDYAATSLKYSTIDSVCLASFGVGSNHPSEFATGWNVRKASIASYSLDWKPHTFAPPIFR
ncbi:HTH_38 domain-containing protein [Trichonephila clavipes]|uniref:HTH_38 domain-containing protein n=1 Tax=Trichonephila clavipes TaxID=2585209 RepID=A0A8X6WKJ9_TRICX|nr:HTH_38 domain-containing protein [Trichonephila clavipes]